MLRSYAVYSAVLLAASSCSMKKNMDEMHDDTHKMSGTTEGMAKTTEELKKLTEDMAKTTEALKKLTESVSKTTCIMYRSLRQGNAKASRDQDLQDIANAKDVAARLADAAAYMQGYEYQVWSPTCIDEASRDIAIEQSAREMLAKIQGFIKDRSEVGATKTSDNAEVLYALAATLHYVNPLQAQFLKGSTYEVMRPFDMLVKGIELDQARNRGEVTTTDFPPYAEIVGKYEKDAEFILRVRANFLMAYAFSIADSDSFGNGPGKVEKIWRVVTSKIFGTKWSPNVDARTETEIRDRITTSLNYAIETKDALVRLGIDPMTDKTILKLWKDADFSQVNLGEMEKSTDVKVRGKAKAIRELITARDRLLAHGASGSW